MYGPVIIFIHHEMTAWRILVSFFFYLVHLYNGMPMPMYSFDFWILLSLKPEIPGGTFLIVHPVYQNQAALLCTSFPVPDFMWHSMIYLHDWETKELILELCDIANVMWSRQSFNVSLIKLSKWMTGWE